MLNNPHRVLFVSKNEKLISLIKSAFEMEFDKDQVDLVCYTSLDGFHKGFYMNYDVAIVEMDEVISSEFLKANKEHYNWEFLNLLLLVDKNSPRKLVGLFEKLEEQHLYFELDYLSLDSYSNQLIAMAVVNYCKNCISLLPASKNNLTTQNHIVSALH